jgi:glutamyl-tRNA reductase
MGSGLASTLRSRGVAKVFVANRTFDRAEQLASKIGAHAIPLTEIADTLVDTDVLLTSTASSEVLVERAMVEMVMACRDGRPLLVVDVALPRDVDPGVGDIPDVTLLDLDDLKEYAQRSAERRRGEIGKVRAILAAEIERYRAERAAREVGPLVTSLRELAEDTRQGELDRFRTKLAKLDPDARELVDAITQGLVNKLLHEPTVRVKDAAGTPRGDYYADALASLFDLPTEPTVESE